jgi:uncharacterized protein YjbJ (UPF0337 family)
MPRALKQEEFMGNNLDLRAEGHWDQAKGKIKEAWGTLTDDELDKSEGKWEQLVGTIKTKTGETVEAIEDKLGDLLERVKNAGSR